MVLNFYKQTPSNVWKVFHGKWFKRTILFNVFVYAADGTLNKVVPKVTYIDDNSISLNFGKLGLVTGIAEILYFRFSF